MSDPFEDPHADPAANPAAATGTHWTDSAVGRLVGALVAPKKTFESIRRRPTWVLALVVLFVAGAASQAVIMSKVDMAEVMRQQMADQGQELDDEQLAQMEKFAWIGPACGLALIPVGYAVLGLLLMGLISLAGGEANFHRGMAIATHGTMPQLVVALLSILVALGSSDLDIARIQLEGGMLTSNLAFLAPEGASPALVVALAAVDVFSLWNVVLLILGVTVVGGLSTGAGSAVVLGLWVLWVAIRIGLSFLAPGSG